MKGIVRSGISTPSKPVQNGGVNHVIKSNGSIGQHHNSNGIGHHVRFKDNKYEDHNGHNHSAIRNEIKHDNKSIHVPNGVLKHSHTEISDQTSAFGSSSRTDQSSLPIISEKSHVESQVKNNDSVEEGQRDVISSCPNTPPESIEQRDAENTDRSVSPTPGTSKGTLFRDTVRRHFNSKDKFFNLVTTLLNSVQEEKRAHLDLINSFETARKIKVEVHEPPSSVPRRSKHRRRQAAVPLAVKIQQNRELQQHSNKPHIDIPDNTPTERQKNSNSGKNTIDEARVKDSKDRIIKSEHSDTTNDNRTEDNNVESNLPKTAARPSLEKLFPKSFKNTADNVLTVTADVEELPDSDKGKDSDKCSNKSSEEEPSEDKSDSGITHSDTNDIDSEKDQVDKLVLDSVLSNNWSSADSILDNEDEKHKLGKDKVIIVEVESDSDSEYCDKKSSECTAIGVVNSRVQHDLYRSFSSACVIDLGGTYEEMSSSDEEDTCGRVEVEDLGDDGSDNEIHALNEKMANISTIEYERKPKRRIRPQLDPISEAESSKTSFNTLASKSNDSSDLLEVQYSIESDDNYHINNRDKNLENNIVSTRARVLKETGNEPTESNCNNSLQNGVDSPTQMKQTIDETSMKGISTKARSKKSEKNLSLDLVGVYSENKDLQRVDKREITFKPKRQVNKKSHRTKSGKCVKHKNNIKDSFPLTHKQTRNIRSPRAVSCTSTRSAPDLHAHRRTEIVDFYRSYESQKDLYRYRKPDNILWNRIDVSERCVSAAEKYGDPRDCRDDINDTGNNRGLLKREQDEPNTLRSWDMPLMEAVKRVKSATNLPIAPDLYETTPRHVRVQQMYSHLKKMRRGSGYTTCKPLISLTRRPNDFRF